MLDVNLQKKYLNKIETQLLLRKRWSYLRYLHLREGFKKALAEDSPVQSFLSVGCGLGLAEIALALEYTQTSFYLTDFDSDRYKMAKKIVEDWSISNVTFGIYDALKPSENKYDFVASIEVLEHIQNDFIAFSNMCKTAKKYIFALVPFATDEMNEDPKIQEYVWRKHEHYRSGYNASSLIKLLSSQGQGAVTIRGCYWKDAGLQLRQKQVQLSNDEIRSSSSDLIKLAKKDIREDIPLCGKQAGGIWMLLKV